MHEGSCIFWDILIFKHQIPLTIKPRIWHNDVKYAIYLFKDKEYHSLNIMRLSLRLGQDQIQ